MRTQHILQLKVTLRHVKPPIWRRITIPEDYTFWDLHVAIQDSMGWGDCHLHEFVARDPVTNEEEFIGLPDPEAIRQVIPEWRIPVGRYLTLQQRRLEYTYDFGDGWTHSVELEQIRPCEGDKVGATCLAGRRRCPPEDCGGPHGYAQLLEVLADPNHPEHEETREWVGKEFKPEEFDASAVTLDDPAVRFREAFS